MQKASKAASADADEDDACMSRTCIVRRNKKPGEYRWISCDSCSDWRHVVCTDIDKNVTDEQLENMAWLCVFCKQDVDQNVSNENFSRKYVQKS